MKRHITLIWTVAASYPLFATQVLFSAPAELVQQIWLTATLLLLLYISPQVFERVRYLTRPAFYSCLLVAALVLLRLICMPFFDQNWVLQMPGAVAEHSSAAAHYAAHEFSISMLLNQLFAVFLLDVLRLRSQHAQQNRHDQQPVNR